MKKVLQVFGEPLSNGGQESFIINVYRNIDRKKVQFDFFTPYYCNNNQLINEIKSYGGKVYDGKGKFGKVGNKKDFITKLKKFLKENSYETVHIHSGSIFSLAFGAKIAKKYGAKKVIVHSHATGNDNIKHKIIKLIATPIFLKNATDYLACSYNAASWKFPSNIIRKKKYKIINNGINIDKFRFSDEIRKQYRKELKLGNSFVICHVGRFSEEKNHKFLIKLFKKIKNKKENSKLLLVGEGSTKENIVNLVNELNLVEDVIFLGIRNDVNCILQASDLFIFPSLFEGLGFCTIEAQATGLKTICSKNIPDEANITDIFEFIDLNDDINKWVDISCENYTIKREKYAEIVKNKGYDEKMSAQKLEKIYLGDDK